MCIRCTDKIYMGGKEKVRNPTRGVLQDKLSVGLG
jgi:hypothetical protein